MSEPSQGHGRARARGQTDGSLRVERDRTDALVTTKRDAVEQKADDVVELARERADEVVQTARHDADQLRAEDGTVTHPGPERERARADAVLQEERAIADATLEGERLMRRRYLSDFLELERDATDQHLLRERSESDTLVASRDAFLANVSHDLRTLLGGLSLNEGLVRQHAPEGDGGDAVRRHAAASARLVARMGRLISDLLDVVSIDAGKLAVVLEEVEVGELVRDTLDGFRPAAEARGLTLQADTTAAPRRARVDPGRILQVLGNLVSNAIKFTPSTGRVSIRVWQHEDALHLAVSDTGVGIAEGHLGSIFERFRQANGVDGRGLGLGLHIARCIVEAHGGTIRAKSTIGAGSTFEVTLPGAVAVRPSSPPGTSVGRRES